MRRDLRDNVFVVCLKKEWEDTQGESVTRRNALRIARNSKCTAEVAKMILAK